MDTPTSGEKWVEIEGNSKSLLLKQRGSVYIFMLQLISWFVITYLNLNLKSQTDIAFCWPQRGRKLKAYINPLISFRWRSSLFLKPFNEFPSIIFLSNLFHSFITLLLKEYLEISNLTLFLLNFNEWPRKLDCECWKNKSVVEVLWNSLPAGGLGLELGL